MKKNYDWVDEEIKRSINAKRANTGSVPVPTTSPPVQQPISQSQQVPKPTMSPVWKPPSMGQTMGALSTANEIANKIPVVGGAKRAVGAGLGWAGQQIAKSSYAFGGYLRGARKYAEENASMGLAGIPKGVMAGIKNIPTGIREKTTPGIYLTEDVLHTQNPLAKAGISLATDLVADPLNLLSLTPKLLPSAWNKVGKFVNKIGETKPVQKAFQFARETPAVYKPIEATVNQYFRNPEVGKIIEGARETSNLRVNKLYRQVSEAATGLSPAKQARIGQLIEGGVSSGKGEERLAQIANEFKILAEQIGKEAVGAGLLNPQSYEKYKGKYMAHIWDAAAKGGGASNIPKISGQFFKERTGAEGYVREFAAPIFKGLGTEMNDIEAARMYKEIATKFGVKVEKTKTGEEVVKDLLNAVLKEYKKPKAGLGDMTFEQTADYKESLMPVIDFLRDKVPSLTPEGQRMGSKLVMPRVKKGAEGVADIVGVGTPAYDYPNVAGKAGRVAEGALQVKLGKVGTMPKPKIGPTLLDSGKFTRKIAEGYKYAPDELSAARGAKILKDVALPPVVLDYLKRNNVSAKNDLTKIFDKGVNAWKAGKTIYNPAYHTRNIISNQILSDLQTGEGLPSTVINYIKSVKSYLGKGDQKFVREAVDSGLIKRKNFAQAVEEFLDTGFEQESKIKQLIKKPAEFQQFSEETAKLNVFTHFRKQGLSVADSIKKAEEAIFSPYRLSSTERSVLGKVFPFYSFTRQAAPFVAKKLLTHPERFTKYPKFENAIQQLTEKTAPDEKNMPDYMKGMVRVPSKNKSGQQEYLNTQYLYPWGNFLQEGGGGMPLGLGLNPLMEEYAAQKTGVDPYFKSEFIREGMTPAEKTKARLGHAANTFMPALYRSIVGKIIPALQGRSDYQGRERDLLKTAVGELSGFKLYPYDTTQGMKNKSYTIYKINDDFNTERKRILKDQSLTPEEKTKRLKDVLDYKNERLKKALSQ